MADQRIRRSTPEPWVVARLRELFRGARRAPSPEARATLAPSALSHRAVEPADLPRICTFPRSADELFFLYPKATFPLTVDQLRRSIEARIGSTVVLDGAEVAGFANLYAMPPEGTLGIGNVIVAPVARGRGVGRYLVEIMAREALRAHGARAVEIACFHANVAGLRLYQALGFDPYRIEPRVDHRGARAALVRMRLSERGAERLLA